MVLQAECIMGGGAVGEVLHSDVALSFMGGVDPHTGDVIDKHHPWNGRNIAGKIVALPSGRGSCGASGVLFEMLWAGTAPAALIFSSHEPILTLGALISREMFGRSLPILRCRPEDFSRLRGARTALVDGGTIALDPGAHASPEGKADPAGPDLSGFDLSERDRRFLDGEFGEAGRLAMRIVVQAARLEGASRLMDVEMAHIDGCFYQGPASLAFAERLADLGGRVAVPSTMNALCVDRHRWRRMGVPASMGEPSDRLADAYVRMGVQPSYTCAPYLLEQAPAFGQQIAWSESNAVVFANSVIGARTLKYPDYLDICMALVGRAPEAGCHLAEERKASLKVDVTLTDEVDDSFYAVLGYHVGKFASHEIPVICGLEQAGMSRDDLKAFGAAFATTSAAPMFHVVGVTPEAARLEDAIDSRRPVRELAVGRADLLATWQELSTATTADVDVVSFGNPHFSITECERLASACEGRSKTAQVFVGVTCGREVYRKARAAGFVETIEMFGGTFINDTCWCLIKEPVIPPSAVNIMTNSGKYAHYGPAALDRGFHIGSLEQCVEAACSGRYEATAPGWLASIGPS